MDQRVTSVSQPARILVAEDDAGLRDQLVSLLSEEGFEVSAVTTGRDAAAAMGQRNFNLVISDIRMPGGDGLELLVGCRRNHPLRPKFILITGFAMIEPNEAQMLGANAFFYKPFEIEDLLDCIHSELAH